MFGGAEGGAVYFTANENTLYRCRPFSGQAPEAAFQCEGTIDAVDVAQKLIVYSNGEESQITDFTGEATRTLPGGQAEGACFMGGKLYYAALGNYMRMKLYRYDPVTLESANLPTQYPEPSRTPRPGVTASALKSVEFSIGGFGLMDIYSVDKNELILRRAKKGGGRTDAPEELATWNTAQWDAFAANLLDCGVSRWKEEYMNERVFDGTQWHLTLTGDFGTLEFSGSNDYPDEWEAFLKVLGKYFGTEVR